MNAFGIFNPALRRAAMTLIIVQLAAFFQFASQTGVADTVEEKFSSDTVLVDGLDKYITSADTGEFAVMLKCTVDAVRLSHKKHHDEKKIACITCHHRDNNDDRIKECSKCHKGVDGLDKMHTQCGTCHAQRLMDTRCATCHRRADGQKPVKPSGSPDISLDRVKFSHVNHLFRKKDCKFCHAGKKKEAWSSAANYPEMPVCLTCHNGGKAPKSCTVCHRDVRQIMPQSHKQNWLARGGHGEEVLFNRKSCYQCHNEVECNQCHFGLTQFKVHPAGYRVAHSFDANSGDVNCSMCHQSGLSCAKCHEGKR